VGAVGLLGLASPAAAAPPENRTPVIVQLTPGSDSAAEARRAAANGGTVSHVYRTVYPGFAGAFTEQALTALRRNPRVELIEPDGVATASATQEGAVWGLDRIDQRALPLNTTYTYPAAGNGVAAYVIDTGIAAHTEFGTRLSPVGYTAITDSTGTGDCNGHGTHVAGTIAGDTYGVAKQTTLIPVRVLGCTGSGSWSGVIAGIDWVVDNHGTGPAVANMSLGGSPNRSVDRAVQGLVKDGVSVAVAAGNDNRDACSSSPAKVSTVLTVGATTENDSRASFSNFGSCLDLFAPGVNITSAWNTGATGSNTISGTSMAAPHVAGAAAVLLAQNPALTPSEVASQLTGASTTNVITNAGTQSPNRLLYVRPT
jgi:subtilisin family serine protease